MSETQAAERSEQSLRASKAMKAYWKKKKAAGNGGRGGKDTKLSDEELHQRKIERDRAYHAKKRAEKRAYDPERKRIDNAKYRAKKKAEGTGVKVKPPSQSPEMQKIYQARYAAKRKAEKRAAANGAAPTRKNGHALAEWKPGKGSIGVPEVLKVHGSAPRSASHAALVERALGLIEAGLVLVQEELGRKG